MRMQCSLAFVMMATSALQGEPPKKIAPKDPTLRIGDPAPPLLVSKWLNGKEIKSFEPGRVYVIEFWALWCGPCLCSMPSLANLQNDYQAQGLTVIGVTKKDELNEAAQVEAYITKRSKRYAYTFAFCENEVTYEAYMKAAGHSGIPTAFVIGKTGKIEFIGHAMELEWVVPLVIAGKWNGQVDIDKMHKELKRISSALDMFNPSPAQALKDFSEFENDYPKLMAGYYYQSHKLRILLTARKYDEAKKLAESLIQTAIDSKNVVLLNFVQTYWSFPLVNTKKKYPEITLKAAEAALKIEGDDVPGALFDVAEAHFFMGDKVKANEYGQKAIAAATGVERKKYEERLKTLLED